MTASETESMIALRDFVDLNLARRLEMAETLVPEYVQALQHFAPAATSEVIAGGTAVFGGITYPANHIVGMGLYGPVTSADLDAVEEFYRSKGVPCEIVISPLSDRSLLDSLAGRGYRVTEFNSVLIRRIEAGKLVEPSAGITIERVTAATAKLWDSVIVRGYSELVPVPENLFVPFATIEGSMNFIAHVEGVPAGGSMGAILRDAGIAALFGTATLREFRGRGVQTALINRRLWEAGCAGCEYAVVSTLPGSGSQRNMERRGFRVAYTKLVMVRTWPELTPAGADDGH